MPPTTRVSILGGDGEGGEISESNESRSSDILISSTGSSEYISLAQEVQSGSLDLSKTAVLESERW